MARVPGNKLYFGDNLVWLANIPSESIDLIYLDPPFNSQVAYNVLYHSPNGTDAGAQYQAFVDSWRWDIPADIAFARVMQSGSPAAGIISALQNFMQKSDLMAYLTMMAARLIELHRVLKPTGSLYLHCDSSASHYLKILLDAIFGAATFRNEIIWRRYGSHNDVKHGFAAVHDTILFYAKTDKAVFNRQYDEHNPEYVAKAYRHADDDGRRWRVQNLVSPSRRPNLTYAYKALNGITYQPHTNGWKYTPDRMAELDKAGRIVYPRNPTGRLALKSYLDEMKGVPLPDVWTNVPSLSGSHAERLGYPTQKPLALLERIILASSSEGDTILDPFCGCGTAIEAAQRHNRKWVGIDITALAIDVVERRLSRIGMRRGVDYMIDGVPLDMDGARRLFEQDPHQFQLWALTLVDGQPREGGKKGADKGVDGIIYFQDDAKTIARGIVSVKGGENIHAEHVRELIGAMNNQGAKLGVFICLHKPKKPMEEAARAAGSVEAGGKLRPRVQIRTIEQLLDNRKPDLPLTHDVISAASAARRGRSAPDEITPEDIRQSPQFKYSIKGSKEVAQATLPMDEPLLVQPGHRMAGTNVAEPELALPAINYSPLLATIR